jgi:hypothetical protein
MSKARLQGPENKSSLPRAVAATYKTSGFLFN